MTPEINADDRKDHTFERIHSGSAVDTPDVSVIMI
jgi:hypothetical protein